MMKEIQEYIPEVLFFSKKGVPEVMSVDDLFKFITGCDFLNRVALETIQETFKLKPHLVDRPGIDLTYNFDNAWEKAESGEIPPVNAVFPVEKVLSDIDLPMVEPPKA